MLTKMRDALREPEARDFILTAVICFVMPWVMFG